MVWAIAYLIGMGIMKAIFSWQDRNFRNINGGTPIIGRFFATVLWPIFLPIVILLWVQSHIETQRDKIRLDEWRKKE